MVNIKEMPHGEKYAKVTDNMKFDETFILPFVQKHLGDQAVAELKKTWQEGMKPIPEGASFEERYEIAYGNWIWLAKSVYSFVRNRMGEDGIKKFERAEVEGLKTKKRWPSPVCIKTRQVIFAGYCLRHDSQADGLSIAVVDSFLCT